MQSGRLNRTDVEVRPRSDASTLRRFHAPSSASYLPSSTLSRSWVTRSVIHLPRSHAPKLPGQPHSRAPAPSHHALQVRNYNWKHIYPLPEGGRGALSMLAPGRRSALISCITLLAQQFKTAAQRVPNGARSRGRGTTDSAGLGFEWPLLLLHMTYDGKCEIG